MRKKERTRIQQTLLNRSWRLNHLYSIVDKESHRRTFKQNLIQRQISETPGLRKMILKARQFGVSTNGLIDQFDFTITNENVTSCVLAHEQDAIKKLFRIIHRAYRYLIPELTPMIDRGGGSKYEMYFPLLNSRIYCDLESRGDTIHWLHISEMAFIREQDRVKATLQAVPIGTGRVQLESTPNGMGNLFHEMWVDPDQPYAKLFFPWFSYPDYKIPTAALTLTDEERTLIKKVRKNFKIELTHDQIQFRRYKQKELGSLFLQEYPEDDQACFLSSGQAAIDLFKVKAQMDEKRPVHETIGNAVIYKKYDRNRRYACGADCAEGVGGDFSAASMFDVHSLEQVATLHVDMKAHDFAQELYDFCGIYHTSGRQKPLLGVERNNHGHAVLLQLQNLKYENLYQHKDERYGWLTDKVTRPIMIDTFIDGVENRTAILNDPITLQECLTLINNNGKIEAVSGKHDDCIMAAAIALRMCIECATLDVYDNVKEKILVG